jgi:RNA polymerase-interacting CarD/CdnL/TRCF family regulator
MEQGLKIMFAAGDLVFHPRNGFGTIRGLTRRDPHNPIPDVVASEGGVDPAQDYYDIQLMAGGTLLVPVSRAERVGLRVLTNGVSAITLGLRTPAQDLPADARQRAAELLSRCQTGEPSALTATVRDMVTHSRGRTLSGSEKIWLDKACERLITEAALVDHISKAQARASIWDAIQKLSAV